GTNSAEAAIHYSGLLEVKFRGHGSMAKTFQLDQPGDSFRLRHSTRLFFMGLPRSKFKDLRTERRNSGHTTPVLIGMFQNCIAARGYRPVPLLHTRSPSRTWRVVAVLASGG